MPTKPNLVLLLNIFLSIYITQNDIVKVGLPEFVMGGQPNTQWGIGLTDLPPYLAY